MYVCKATTLNLEFGVYDIAERGNAVMLERLKSALVGRSIEDIGTVNRQGVRHAMFRLSGNVLIYAPWDEVETVVTTIPRPMGKALTSAAVANRLKVG